MNHPGSITVIEGLDASGKETQSKLLVHRIRSAGYEAERVSFPNYGSSTGQMIQQALAQKFWLACDEQAGIDLDHVRAMTLQALMNVNRYELADHLRELTRQGVHLVLDRYYISGEVYGRMDGLDAGWLARVHSSLPAPTLTLLLDVTPQESFKRRPERQDYYERNLNFLEKVRAGYLRWFREQNDPENYPVLNGQLSVDDLTERIWKLWKDHHR